jgi:hypothetical protein
MVAVMRSTIATEILVCTLAAAIGANGWMSSFDAYAEDGTAAWIFYDNEALPVVNQADGLPRYDPQTHCKEVASFVGSYSTALENACLAEEQSAYDALKNGWSDLPAKARTHCDEVARCCGTGSYFLLQACIQQELEPRSSRPKFRH